MGVSREEFRLPVNTGDKKSRSKGCFMKKLWIRSEQPLSEARIRRIYEGLIPTIKRIARRCGYAAAIHGTLTRDCDVLAAPWTKQAVLPVTLAARLHAAICRYPLSASSFRRQKTSEKPHGRIAYVLYVGCYYRGKKCHALYVDLSVMPPL